MRLAWIGLGIVGSIAFLAAVAWWTSEPPSVRDLQIERMWRVIGLKKAEKYPRNIVRVEIEGGEAMNFDPPLNLYQAVARAQRVGRIIALVREP